MAIPYIFHPKLVMRTPQKPLSLLQGEEVDFFKIIKNDPAFLEALFLASPVLYTELMKLEPGEIDSKKKKKLFFSLAKYYLRMSSRCTPFGLFSGCSVAEWGQQHNSLVLENEKLNRHTRLDMHYLCALAKNLSVLPVIKNRLLYFPNDALYAIAEELRYIEHNYDKGEKKYIISAILNTGYLTDLLKAAENGISKADMIDILLKEENDAKEEIESFIDQIIETQIMVSEMEPAVTGAEFLYQIIATLKRINTPENTFLSQIIQDLEQIAEMLENIDTNSTNEVSIYHKIMESLKKFDTPFVEGKLFQTDLNFNLKEKKVDIKYQAEILEALNIINLFNKKKETNHLLSFAKRFYHRYQDAEVPLLEVLDNETGIGYAENENGKITPLLHELAINTAGGKENNLIWEKKDKFLLDKLLETLAFKNTIVELNTKELEEFQNNWDSLPPSMSVLFRLLGNDTILLETCGSSSAINLLGRFAHGNKAIHQIIKEIVNEEDQQNPSIIFAEIVHLPQNRTGNILLHPAFRKYEIPFLSKSSVAPEYQIHLQDLLVSVKNNLIFLRSKKLNKIVVPRLSTAHNYSIKALPVYQFLADMQLQNLQSGINFNWGPLEKQYKFLPRVTYKNVILHAAKWNFTKKDISALSGKSGADLMKAVVSFKAKWRLPKLVVIAEGDNELLIDLDNLLLVELWLDTIKNKEVFVIKEFLGWNSPVKNAKGDTFCNQFISLLIRNTNTYNYPVTNISKNNPNIENNFLIGSKWVYYKIYCGYKTADRILQFAIYPLYKKLIEEKVIDAFFFIRYNDPDFHIRVRFQIKDTQKLNYIISLLNEKLKPYLSERLIWNIQNDIYKRELERYGHKTIEQTEYLFYHDSIAVLKFLELTEGDDRENLRWKWALRAIDEWLNAFGYITEKKLATLKQIRDAYFEEFKPDKLLKEQLSNKYRKSKKEIEEIMNQSIPENSPLNTLIQILREKSAFIIPIALAIGVNAEKPSITEVMPSYIHMLVNRIVISDQRQHELVIYDMLYNYYRSLMLRNQ